MEAMASKKFVHPYWDRKRNVYLTIGLAFWGNHKHYEYSTGFFYSFEENKRYYKPQHYYSSGVSHDWTPREKMLARINRSIERYVRKAHSRNDIVRTVEITLFYDDDPLYFRSDPVHGMDAVYTVKVEADNTVKLQFLDGKDILNEDVFATLPLQIFDTPKPGNERVPRDRVAKIEALFPDDDDEKHDNDDIIVNVQLSPPESDNEEDVAAT